MPRNTTPTLAEMLAEIGWSPREFADRAGLTHWTVRQIIAGQKEMPDALAAKVQIMVAVTRAVGLSGG